MPIRKSRSSGASQPNKPKRKFRLNKRGRMTPRQREYQLLLRLKATPSEQLLQSMLDTHPLTRGRFEFQAHVCGFFPDFACHAAKLIVELDGACHSNPKSKHADERRSAKLARAGWAVIRFWNGELRRPDTVLDRIVMHLTMRASLPSGTMVQSAGTSTGHPASHPSVMIDFSDFNFDA